MTAGRIFSQEATAETNASLTREAVERAHLGGGPSFIIPTTIRDELSARKYAVDEVSQIHAGAVPAGPGTSCVRRFFVKKIKRALTGFQKSNESNRAPCLRFVSRDAGAPL